MAKADVKKDYYAALELPPSASIDDIKKKFRKLALKYHPDRNPGKEAEMIPKFQAIQAAHEILEDPVAKAKYDADRRRFGIPSGMPIPTYGNPYQAKSNFPPPPRRTPQPESWRPGSTGFTPSDGANRFTNFPRPAPTAPKPPPRDSAQERANVFNAWQNMNHAQKQAQAAAQATTSETPPRRPNATRSDTRFPSEEEIRRGARYKQAYDKRAEEARSAWQQFQSQNAGKPGMSRSASTRTPKKNGFDPGVSGADEQQASSTANYSSRLRTEQAPKTWTYPPQPSTPTQRSTAEKKTDPASQFRTRVSEEDAPYARSPSVRKATQAQGADSQNGSNTGRPRSASPSPNGFYPTTNASTRQGKSSAAKNQAFVVDTSSESDERSNLQTASSAARRAASKTSTTNGRSSNLGNDVNFNPWAGTSAEPSERRKKQPTPPSRKINTDAPPNASSAFGGGETRAGSSNHGTASSDGVSSSGMGRKKNETMYDSDSDIEITELDFPSSSQWSREWPFGSSQPSKKRRLSVPNWAIPSSVLKQKERKKRQTPASQQAVNANAQSFSNGEAAQQASSAPQSANAQSFSNGEAAQQASSAPQSASTKPYFHTRGWTHVNPGKPTTLPTPKSPVSLTKDTTSAPLDAASPILSKMPAGENKFSPQVPLFVQATQTHHSERFTYEDSNAYKNISFTFPIDDDTFMPTSNARTRSEDNINTSFSTNTFPGTFTGAGTGFFAPPPPPPSQTRPATFEIPLRESKQTGFPPPPPRPYTSNAPASSPMAPPLTFSADEWTKSTWDLNPKKPPSPVRPTRSRTPSRQPSKTTTKPGVVPKPVMVQAVDEEEDLATTMAAQSAASPDAMDIDSDTPSKQSELPPLKQSVSAPAAAMKETARRVSVPPSPWRQQVNDHTGRATSKSDTIPIPGLNITSDGPANAVPPAPVAQAGMNLGELGSSLPSSSMPSSQAGKTFEPQTFTLPPLPKPPVPPTRLSKTSWTAYADSMSTYLTAFHAFNGSMLDHFQRRYENEDALLQTGTLWLGAQGEPRATGDAPVGFPSFCKQIKEDERVREHWNVGCERQREAVVEFDRVRERIRERVAGGVGLPD
ncbi:hypothetical protein LTR50_007015 [Elasticomyces elasticus]|nr:hypothetical protein LTR50_007015 [Elasticomyces elasticus]